MQMKMTRFIFLLLGIFTFFTKGEFCIPVKQNSITFAFNL